MLQIKPVILGIGLLYFMCQNKTGPIRPSETFIIVDIQPCYAQTFDSLVWISILCRYALLTDFSRKGLDFSFEELVFNWDPQDAYWEFQRFKQHVEFPFKGPLAKSDKPDRAGWLGKWIDPTRRRVLQKNHIGSRPTRWSDAVLSKLEKSVKTAKNNRIVRFKAKQRKQNDGETLDNFVKDLRLLLLGSEYTESEGVLVELIINGVKHPKIQERLLDQGQEFSLKKKSNWHR